MNFLLIIFLCSAIHASVPASPDAPQAPRITKLDATRPMTLADQGKNYCEIIIPDDSSPVVKFAAAELRQYLSQSFDAAVPILNTPSGNGVAIRLGDSEENRQQGIDPETLPRDGFQIKAIDPNTIMIAGRDDPTVDPTGANPPWGNLFEHATIFGVYEFLERFIGAKFIFPGEIGTVIPKHDSLTVPMMEIFDRPDFTVRQLGGEDYGKWYDDSDETVSRRKNQYFLRLQTRFIPNGHGLGQMGLAERFGQSNPDYFALLSNHERSNNPATPIGSHLCFTSPVTDEIYLDAKSFLSGESPSVRKIYHHRWQAFVWDNNAALGEFFNVQPQDGMTGCLCERCKALPINQGELVWNLTIQWANQLKKDGVPGYLTQMAYNNMRPVPAGDIPDNVLVMVAPNGPWSERLPELKSADDKLVKEWSQKLGRKIWLWNYVNKYAATKLSGVPPSTPRAVGNYYKNVAPYIFGAFMQNDTDYAIFQFLNNYVFSRIMWNQDTDVSQLLAETYQAMFGNGSAEMEQFFVRLEELWLTGVLGKPIDTPMGPSYLVPGAYDLWGKVYTPEEMVELDQLLISARTKAQGDEMAQKRIDFIRKNIFDILNSEQKRFHDTQKSIGDLIFNTSPLPAGQTVTIDGELNEAAWKNAPAYVLNSMNGEAIEVKTTVKLLRDRKYLYLAIDCEEPRMDSMAMQKRQFDDPLLWQDSTIEIFINPSGDRTNYQQIMINPYGDVSDLSVRRVESNYESDWSSNSNVVVLAKRNKNNWTLELKIPRPAQIGPFPFNIFRNRTLKNNDKILPYYSLSPFIRTPHDIINFGLLSFVTVPDDNLLQNSDFAQPQSGRFFGVWGTDDASVDSGKIVLDDKRFINGGRSIRMDNRDKQCLNISQYVQLKPETNYQLSYFVRTENMVTQGDADGAFAQVYAGGNVSYPLTAIRTDIPWTRYSFDFKTPAKLGEVSYIRLINNNCTGIVHFDNIQLKEIK